MSTPDSVDSGLVECLVCQLPVPKGRFCGMCGIPLSEHAPRRGWWIRANSFTASPNEHVLRPNLVSTLFPHLAPTARAPFLAGLGLILAGLIAATLLRLPGALITVAALGLPLLFLIYLQESDVYADIPTSTLVATAGLGIGLGVGWVLLSGALIDQVYDVGLGTGIAASRVLSHGLGVPVAGLLLMLAPALVIRLIRPGQREALDGFAIGALGALTSTAAAQLTRLAPQFADGMVAADRPIASLFVEAGIRGVSIPLTAAAVGGLVGTALWFARSESKRDQHRTLVRASLGGFAALVLGMYVALGLVDVARFPQFTQLALHLTVAAAAILALRLGLQLALLHEAHDDIQAEHPMLCTHCGHVVPDMPICVACGVVGHACSRTSRLTRRTDRPSLITPEPDPSPKADDS